MVAMAFYEIGQGSVYLFYEQLGFRAGLDSEAIGGIIGLANLTGLIGGVLAAWMGNRYGTIGPIVIGIALNVAAALGLTLSENSVAYFWLNFLWTVAYSFVVPYILGVLSDMDDLGRWVVAMDAVWWLGDAPAPFVGGWLVESGGYSRLAGVPVFTGAVCIVLIVLVLRRFNAQQEQPSGP
jgi:MFS family permease